jgi:hypothetical protein
MAASFGLYYPFIHFKDENWLKLSAIYFDKMYRVVPSGYRTEDSETVKALGDFVDVVLPEEVAPRFVETFAEFFDQFQGTLVERYGVHKIDEWKGRHQRLIPPTAGGPSGKDPRLDYVHLGKIPPDISERLLKSRLAKFDPGDVAWVGMHPVLARVYITALADQLAGQRQLQPMTDETLDHLAISGLTPERLAQLLLGEVQLVDERRSEREIEQAFAFLAVQNVVPKNIAEVPAAKIVKIRERLAGERGKFQAAAVDFAHKNAGLVDVADERAFQAHLKAEFDKTIAPELEKLKDALRGNDVDVALSAVNVKVELPALAATTLAALGLGLNPLAGAAAGVALLVAKVLRDRRKGRQALLTTSPVSYLFRVEEELSPAILANWVRGDALKHRLAH